PFSSPRRAFSASFRDAGTRISASGCPGTGSAREPGIHTHGQWLWIPALAASRLGRNDQLKALAPSNTSSFPRCVFCARVLKLWLRYPDRRVAERRESSGACEAPVGPARNAAGQAPNEAPCVPIRGTLASRRSTVAILGSGPALPS